ncbi:MAG: Asp23/Gls24 family envelope stress response protein [Acidimicrobiales bacterium]
MSDVISNPNSGSSAPAPNENGPNENRPNRSTSGGGAVSTLDRGTDLVTEQGRTSIADSVVAKIAGVAAREVAGVHAMGGGTSRAIGAIREAVGNPSASQGVSVEVGERQAAIDLTLVVDYGASIVDLADGVRSNVINRTERMTGLEVTEVNIAIDDVYLGETDDDDDQQKPPPPPRVQ